MKRFLRSLAVLAGFTVTCALAQAPYPSKPVRLFVPFAAGGAVDIVARHVAQSRAEATGGPFIVENKPGAGGLLALGEVAKAPADGYTLAVGSPGPPPTRPQLFSHPHIHPLR